MATKTDSPKSRIRWTAEESALVVRAAQDIQAEGVKLSGERRLARAQAGLPKHRRRPYSANLGSWLAKAARGDAGDAGDAAAGAATAKAAGRAAGRRAPALAADRATAALTEALIASGAAILKGILLDPGVRKALRQALR